MATPRNKPVKLEWSGNLTEGGDSSGRVAIRGEKSNEPKQPSSTHSSFPKRAKMRREVKGRAGHPVLVLFGWEPAVSESVLNALCSRLKGRLGCGGSCQENTIVLQTENADRLAQALHSEAIACVPSGGKGR